MGRIIDLTGQKFGKLTVIKRVPARNGRSSAYWLCQCDCGNTREVQSSDLRNGSVKNCGCGPKNYHFIDMTGQRVGKLTILEKVPPPKFPNGAYWRCRCDCGNETIVSGAKLRTGGIKTCGKCPRSYLIDLTGKKFGRLTAIERVPAPEGKQGTFWRCECDFGNEMILSSKNLRDGILHACKDCPSPNAINLIDKQFGKLTVIEKVPTPRGRTGVFWRCKCQCGSDCIVSTCDLVNYKQKNCGCEEREVSKPQEFMMAVGGTYAELLTQKVCKTNKTGYKGVYKRAKETKYRALITVAGKKIYLGTFDTLEEAVEARKKGEEKYFKPLLEEAAAIKNKKHSKTRIIWRA